jgi:hypothetical protein
MKLHFPCVFLAGIIAGIALPCRAAKLESTTPVPPELFAQSGPFSLYVVDEPPAGPVPTGTVAPKAMILPMIMFEENDGLDIETLWCAIDRSAPGADFDVVRIDSRQTGSFKNADAFKLKPIHDLKDQWEFSGIIQVKSEAKMIPCLINGTVNGKLGKTIKQDEDPPTINFYIVPFASGTLDLNGKTCRVAVADGNGNGRLTDAARLAEKNYPDQPTGKKAGDGFVIDLDNNGFQGRTLTGCLGVPFCLNGHWLMLQADAATQELTAVPLPDPGTGTLELPPNLRLEARISGGGCWFPIIDGQPPIPLKAGKYRVAEARLPGPGKAACELDLFGTPMEFEIKDGAKTVFPAPHRINVSVEADCETIGPVRLVSLKLKMISDIGIKISEATAADGRQVVPSVKILDAKGQVVHTGKFTDDEEIASFDDRIFTWRVPAALSGEFTAVVDCDLPLPVEAIPGRITVPPPSKKAITLTLPVQDIQASTGIDPDCPGICAFDDHFDTYFATARPPKPGDLVTVVLAKPIDEAAELLLNLENELADNPDDEEKALPGKAVLEISSNGTVFQAVDDLTDTGQTFDIKDKKVVAFRIRFTSDWTVPFRLTEVEVQKPSKREQRAQDAQWLKKYDLNGNGKLEPEERTRAEKDAKAGIEAPAIEE